MYCPYCDSHYTEEGSCACHPPVKVKAPEPNENVKGPWGEADRKWSEPKKKSGERVIG